MLFVLRIIFIAILIVNVYLWAFKIPQEKRKFRKAREELHDLLNKSKDYCG